MSILFGMIIVGIIAIGVGTIIGINSFEYEELGTSLFIIGCFILLIAGGIKAMNVWEEDTTSIEDNITEIFNTTTEMNYTNTTYANDSNLNLIDILDVDLSDDYNLDGI